MGEVGEKIEGSHCLRHSSHEPRCKPQTQLIWKTSPACHCTGGEFRPRGRKEKRRCSSCYFTKMKCNSHPFEVAPRWEGADFEPALMLLLLLLQRPRLQRHAFHSLTVCSWIIRLHRINYLCYVRLSSAVAPRSLNNSGSNFLALGANLAARAHP